MEVSENLKIEIRPIPNKGGIRGFSENLEYFSQAHIITAFVNPVTRKYDTGLSKEDIEFLKEKEFPYDISDNYMRDVPHPFWESHQVKTELKTTPSFLYPGESLIDFIKYKYLLVNRFIYSSEEEMAKGTKPQATHYIYDESEAVAIKAGKLEVARKLNRKIDELTLGRKRDIILILLNENTNNKTEDYLTVRFNDILQDKFLTSELTKLLEEPAKDISLTAEIRAAIQKNVLKRTKEGIFYFETNLGFAEDDVKKHLAKPENQELYLNIKTKL